MSLSDLFNAVVNGEEAKAMELVQAGCYVSYYLAQINGVDPGPIPWVDWYKDEIRQVV